MKKLISKYWLVLVVLVSVCMFTACSSDDDDAVTPVFPQVQTIAGAAGEVKEFTFDANESWLTIAARRMLPRQNGQRFHSWARAYRQ